MHQPQAGGQRRAAAAARQRCGVRVAAAASLAPSGLQALIFDCDGAWVGLCAAAAAGARFLSLGGACHCSHAVPSHNALKAGVIVESEDIHRMAYNATFQHFDVRCPNAPNAPVVWSEEYYDDLQNKVWPGVPRCMCGGGWGSVVGRET